MKNLVLGPMLCLMRGGAFSSMTLRSSWWIVYTSIVGIDDHENVRKREGLCGSAGGESGAVDPKTFWKWTWPFIQALGLLGFEVVSSIVLSLLKIISY
jgi:hypothetical protein